MYRYQVWMRDKWAVRNASPEETVYSLDAALQKAKDISKKGIPTPTTSYSNPFSIPVSSTETKYPVVFVLDCCQVPQRIRGIAYKGKWRDAIDNCKSCHNYSTNEEDCSFCGGASWSPYR